MRGRCYSPQPKCRRQLGRYSLRRGQRRRSKVFERAVENLIAEAALYACCCRRLKCAGMKDAWSNAAIVAAATSVSGWAAAKNGVGAFGSWIRNCCLSSCCSRSASEKCPSGSGRSAIRHDERRRSLHCYEAEALRLVSAAKTRPGKSGHAKSRRSDAARCGYAA